VRLYKVLNNIFQKLSESEIEIVDTKPIETKLLRFKRHKKKGRAEIIQEDETIFNASKKDSTVVIR